MAGPKNFKRLQRDARKIERKLDQQVQELSKQLRLKDLTEPFGDSGLKRFGGYVYDEWHQDLQGFHKARVFREIYDNGTIAGMFMNAIFLLILQMDWKAEPNEAAGEAGIKEAEFLQRNMNELKRGFKQTISEMLLFLPFGFSLMEEVFLRDEETGRLMWKKFAPRAQESIDQWLYTKDNRDVIGFTQRLEDTAVEVKPVPLSKCLHLIYRQERENPEGRSAFRNIYVSYRSVKTLRWIEGVAFERNGNGMPTFFVPPHMLSDSAGPEEKAMVEVLYTLARQMGMDERMGNVLPGTIGAEGELSGYDFKMITAEGAAQLMNSLHNAINRYELNMARALGVEFMMMGGTSSGSNAMHTDKTSLFGMQIDAIADLVELGLNTQSVPRLYKYNNVPKELQAKIRHGKIDQSSLAEVMGVLEKLVLTGFVVPNAKLGDHVLKMANLPLQDELDEAL